MKKSINIYAMAAVLIVVSLSSYSQENKIKTDEIPSYNNSFKVMALLIPGYGAVSSLGYERALTKHSALELASNYHYFIDEMSLGYHQIRIMPAYKYYTVSDKKILNDFWISIYLSYLYETHGHSESEEYIKHSLYHYGLGGAIGRRLIINKNKRLFFNIGFGISYNYYSDESIFTNPDWSGNMWLYRPIFQFGWKF